MKSEILKNAVSGGWCVDSNEQTHYETGIKVILKKGMRVSVKVCNQLIWKIDTGAKKTFITTRTCNSIQHKFKPGWRPMENKFLTANSNIYLVKQLRDMVFVSISMQKVYFFFTQIIDRYVAEPSLCKDSIKFLRCLEALLADLQK